MSLAGITALFIACFNVLSGYLPGMDRRKTMKSPKQIECSLPGTDIDFLSSEIVYSIK
jgi:hypothetical protein